MMKNYLQQMIDTILARDVERPLKRRAEGDAYWADYVPPSLTELRDKAPQHIKDKHQAYKDANRKTSPRG